MNYPVWDVFFGSGLLIAAVSILHVFVSHFAVGGGLFLVVTERKAYREEDAALLEWLKTHSKFFVLLTVVFGAISGVGIWFTIGLVHPSGTSALIHMFVWGWAIEWVFFFVEISAALLYFYGWDRLDRATHMWFGWIYFIAAFASMVIINGIITFMLTPGTWIANGRFWSGFFNPTYFPSLFIRFSFALALSGIYALITACAQRDGAVKARIVRWSARWIVPAFVVLPALAYWYVHSIPAHVWLSAKGPMPTATRYAGLITAFACATFLLSLVTVFRPGWVRPILAVLVVGCAFGTMWSFEFIREAVRKPYVIYDYMYDNSLYKTAQTGDGGFTAAHIDQAGVLNVARWVQHREVPKDDPAAAGKEIFRVECRTCHTVGAYRGVRGYIARRGWNSDVAYQMLGGLDVMHNSVMPPFSGTDSERRALADFLGGLSSAGPLSETPADGRTIYGRYCVMCHEYRPDNTVFTLFKQLDPDTGMEALGDLPSLNEKMPALTFTDEQKKAFYDWAHAEKRTWAPLQEDAR